MEPHLEQIREQQREIWTRFSGGWRKWDAFTMQWMKPVGDAIIRSLTLKETDAVLDVAAGTGEPGLTIAAIVKQGKVVITDLAEAMLDAARDNAVKKGLTNTETIACDVCALPFADATFDAVSCRFGFMFFPDMLLAAKEIVRVLKPGGRVSAAVWSTPDKNVWVTTIIGIISQHLPVAAPPPGAPGMFRCGQPHFLAQLFTQAGFKNITEKEVTGTLNCGSSATYWDFMTEVAAPVVAAMSKADAATIEKIKKDVFDAVDKKAVLEYGALIVAGEK